MLSNYIEKKSLFIISLFLLITAFSFAQIGINTTNPSNDAILDITSANKGLLIPRINISNVYDIAPITGGATESLLVYNTNNATGKGFHFWNGNSWREIDGGNDWNLYGNSGTDDFQHFIGTTDGEALTFRTNNTNRFRIPNGDQVYAMANGSLNMPFYSWESDPTMGFFKSGIQEMSLAINGDHYFTANSSEPEVEWTFNPASEDINFKVNTNTHENTLFVDGYTNNVGLGTSTPNISSQLELSDIDKGLLINRISLTSTSNQSPIISPTEGLLIYNIATNGSGSTAVVPGFYYWKNSQWNILGNNNSQNNWNLEGNIGTNPSINFIGSTDNVDLVFKTNNNEQMRIMSNGFVGINTDSADEYLDVKGDIDIGGGASDFDSDGENIKFRARSDTWWTAAKNSSTISESHFYIATTQDSDDAEFLIANNGYVNIGKDNEYNPLDMLHVTNDDENETTTIRIDNTRSANSIMHTSLELWDGSSTSSSNSGLQAFFRHNNKEHILEIGQAKDDGIVNFYSGDGSGSQSDISMTLESDGHVTIQNLINLKPGNEPSNPNEGDVYYDASLKKLRLYTGSNWDDLN